MSDSQDPDHPSWSPPAGRPVRASWLVVGAVCSLVLILVSFYYTAQWYDARSGNRMLVAIAENAADQHLQALPLDVEGASLDSVLAIFRSGDSNGARGPLADREQRLLGGRSTSLQGYPAVQLRYAAADGRVVSRYVAVFPPARLTGLPGPATAGTPPRMMIRGVAVNVWIENGLVFAEAY